jgi:hypothetical protein
MWKTTFVPDDLFWSQQKQIKPRKQNRSIQQSLNGKILFMVWDVK